MIETLGGLAGVAASLSWAVSILLFQRALDQYGSLACNLFKAFLGTIVFIVFSAGFYFVGDYALPTSTAALSLFISGIIGMAIGDYAFFQAIIKLGPKQAALIHSTHPVLLLAYGLFSPSAALSMTKSLGVVIVILAVMDVTRNQKSQGSAKNRDWVPGLCWGFCAAFCQAAGILIAKDATMHSHPIHTGMIRLTGAFVGMLLGLLLVKRGRAAFAILSNKNILKLTALPVFIGTFLGIFTMMVAIATCKPAVAGAVLSLAPVFLVPLTAWRDKEAVPIRILIGTLCAVLGVALIY